MSAAQIPIPGSSLVHLERRGTWLAATLATAEGRQGGQLQLLFFNGEAHGTVTSFPLPLAAGTLDSPEGSLEGFIPMPFPWPGAVELHLQGAGGERLTIVGQSLTVRPVDPPPSVVTLGRTSGGLR